MRAYILIKIQPQETNALMDSLLTMNRREIKQACLIHGVFDCIVEVQSRMFQGVAEIVEQIRSLKGVNDTQTCYVTRTSVPEAEESQGMFHAAP